MNRLRLGVIGFGIFGAWHAKAYAGYERAELRAVSDINPDSRKAAEETYGVPTFEDYADLLALPEIDAVSIVVPDHLHRNVCLAAAKRQKTYSGRKTTRDPLFGRAGNHRCLPKEQNPPDGRFR